MNRFRSTSKLVVVPPKTITVEEPQDGRAKLVMRIPRGVQVVLHENEVVPNLELLNVIPPMELEVESPHVAGAEVHIYVQSRLRKHLELREQ
jgi:hypothetical protein